MKKHVRMPRICHKVPSRTAMATQCWYRVVRLGGSRAQATDIRPAGRRHLQGPLQLPVLVASPVAPWHGWAYKLVNAQACPNPMSTARLTACTSLQLQPSRWTPFAPLRRGCSSSPDTRPRSSLCAKNIPDPVTATLPCHQGHMRCHCATRCLSLQCRIIPTITHITRTPCPALYPRNRTSCGYICQSKITAVTISNGTWPWKFG